MESKGQRVRYVTNSRIAFEDEKEGMILNLGYDGDDNSKVAQYKDATILLLDNRGHRVSYDENTIDGKKKSKIRFYRIKR